MPGVVSAQGAPKRMRSNGKVSISIRGMPKFVLVDEAISLNEKRVALKRASLVLLEEMVRAQVSMPKRFWGAVVISPIGRLRPAPSAPVPLKRVTQELKVSVSFCF